MKRTNFLNPGICAACGGTCCKRLPGCAMPDDFAGDLYTKLVEAFRSGKWALDWWEGNVTGEDEDRGRSYYVRPATKGKEGEIYDGSWGGECVFLTPFGCALKPDKRPEGCRMVEPREGEHCLVHGADKKDAAIAWMPHEDILRNAATAAM